MLALATASLPRPRHPDSMDSMLNLYAVYSWVLFTTETWAEISRLKLTKNHQDAWL